MSNVTPPSIPKLSPQIRAGLIGIRNAEGTWREGEDPKAGYSIMFGGGKFDNTKGHPDKVVHGGRYSSAAAGAYQFMPNTWKNVGGGPMTPERQDWGATRLWLGRLGLSQDQHGVNELTRILVRDGGISRNMAHRMAPEWASFPTHAGVSYYGQPVKPLSQINKAYNSVLPLYQKQDKVVTAIERPTGLADLYRETNKPTPGPKEINMLNILNKETQKAWQDLLIGK